jgi:putative Holliday junction resolvase
MMDISESRPQMDSMAPGTVRRILAIDLGERRMGLAVSDPLGLTAQGLPTAERRNRREDLNYIKSLVRKHAVAEILVGNPLNMDGSAGPQSETARAFGERLAQHVDRPVRLWDERLTSVEAAEILKESGCDTTGRAGEVDRVAAVLILRDFLETRRLASAEEK